MAAEPVVIEQKHMDTRVTLTVHPGLGGCDRERLAEAIRGVFAGLEDVFSLFRPDSEIVRLNAAAGRPTAASDIFLRALRSALAMAEETGGVFDPLVGRLTAPGGAELAAGRRPNWRQIAVDDVARTVTLPAGGVLDLNSAAKGLALDLAMEEVVRLGGEDAGAIIEAGGDIRVHGLPPGKGAWDIGIRDPFRVERVAAVLPVRSGAVCTSGNYFRSTSALAAGRRHLVDPRPDAGPSGDAASMTVLAPTAEQADILSTAAFLLPPREAAPFVERHAGCSCLFIDAAGGLFVSPSLKETIYAHVRA